MTKFLSVLLLFVCFVITNAIAKVNVTFQVDMSNQTISSNVFLCGTFNNWNSSDAMDHNDEIYSVTLSFEPGTKLEYKFLNGATWESINGNCTVGGYKNRYLTVSDKDIVLDPVCFNSCTACLDIQVDPINQKVKVDPLIQNNWQTFMWPYNAYMPFYNEGPNGHVGNECGVNSMARLLHYWRNVTNGNGNINTTTFGIYYSCDLETLDLDYENMPYELDWNDSESNYHEIANLMKACSAIGAQIGIGIIGNHTEIGPALSQYFDFKPSSQVIYRNNFTKEEWTNIFKNELSAGRPILIAGRTTDSPEPGELGKVYGHYFICDGYNETGQFYYNYAFNQIRDYADIDAMGVYSRHHYAIIGLEPGRYETSQNVSICNGENYLGYTVSGEYSETMKSASGVDSIVNIQLEVISITEPEINIENNHNCLGEVTALSAPDGDYSYLWSTGETTKSIETTVGGEFSVAVTQNNCMVSSESYSVSKLSLPEKPEARLNGFSELCRGDSAQLLTSTGYSVYEWSNGESQNSFWVNSSGNFSVRVSNENGCTSEWSENIKIIVHESPTQPVISISGKEELCNGDTVKLGAPDGFAAYEWSGGETVKTILVSSSGNYSVRVSTDLGCASEWSESQQVTVYENPHQPEIGVDGELEFCKGDTTRLFVLEGDAGYEWSNGMDQSSISVLVSGSFQVRIQSEHDCKSSWSEIVDVKVHELPEQPIITIDGNILIATKGDSYIWYLENQLIEDETEQLYEIIEDGSYTVQLSSEFGCLSPLSEAEYVNKTSVEEWSNNLEIYPNPTDGIVFLKGIPSDNIINLRLLNSSGQLLDHKEVSSSDNSMDLRNLKSGIYLIQLLNRSFKLQVF